MSQANLITALRAGAAPAATALPPGITLFGNMPNTASSASSAPAPAPAFPALTGFGGNNLLTSQQYSTLPGAAGNSGTTSGGSGSAMFDAGAALNSQYGGDLKERFANNPSLQGVDVPDMRQFGDRYKDLLASESGRNKFTTQVGWANNEMNTSGIYQPGDLGMLPGLSFDDPTGYTQRNYDSLYSGGNSYFLPDSLEIDPHAYAYGYLGKQRSAEENDSIYNNFSGGQRLAGTWTGENGINIADQQIQNLLSYRNNGKDYAPHEDFEFADDGFSAALNPYYQANGVLAGMDVARGSLTGDQGEALTKATQFRAGLDSATQDRAIARALLSGLQSELAGLKVRDGNTDTYAQRKASLENQIAAYGDMSQYDKRVQDAQDVYDRYMQTVGTIGDPSALSSEAIIRALRG